MSRKYVNDKWCVRCGKKTPTPFLKEVVRKHRKWFRDLLCIVDIGCGNGRNTNYIMKISKVAEIHALDMVDDYGFPFVLGKDIFPARAYDLFLANYILMFLNPKQRKQVMEQIDEKSRVGSMLVLEMYPAKDAFKYDWDKMIKWFDKRGWSHIIKRKDKAFLIK